MGLDEVARGNGRVVQDGYRDTEKLPDGLMSLWVATAAVNSSNFFIIHYQLLINSYAL